MKIAVYIPANGALRAGKDAHGWQVVDIPAASLTPEQREVLTQHINLDRTIAADYKLPMSMCVVGGEATPASVLDLLQSLVDQQARERQEREDRKREKQAEYEQLVAAVLAAGPMGLIGPELGTQSPDARRDDKRWGVLSPPSVWVAGETTLKSAEDDRVRPLLAEARRLVKEHDDAIEAAKAAAEQERRQERDRWIREHGSPRLQRMLAEGIEHDAVYRDERLAQERPGWAWERMVSGSGDDPRNVPEEAFAVLDAARATEPEAKLKFWRIEHSCDDDCYDEECEKYDWQGYVATATYLDREIVYGAPELALID